MNENQPDIGLDQLRAIDFHFHSNGEIQFQAISERSAGNAVQGLDRKNGFGMRQLTQLSYLEAFQLEFNPLKEVAYSLKKRLLGNRKTIA